MQVLHHQMGPLRNVHLADGLGIGHGKIAEIALVSVDAEHANDIGSYSTHEEAVAERNGAEIGSDPRPCQDDPRADDINEQRIKEQVKPPGFIGHIPSIKAYEALEGGCRTSA